MNARRFALEALLDITRHGAYANLRLKSLPNALDERDRRFVHSLVYTTLDHLYTIDHYLSAYLRNTVKPTERAVLRLGACEILYMRTPIHAVVNEYVSLMRTLGKEGATKFINAVLRRLSTDMESQSLPSFPHDTLSRLSVQYSYPVWLVHEWVDCFGVAETESLLSAPAASLEVRAQFPYTTEELQSALPVDSARGEWDANALLLEKGFDVASSPLFLSGLMSVMSQSAMLVCRALGDCKGKRVLDACASPGGKSAYLASLAENKISLMCMEMHAHRLELLNKTLERLHVAAETRLCDASIPDPSLSAAFDAVLVDAPCSGLGLLNDKPDVRYAKSDDAIDALAETQRAILDAVCDYVRIGGTLVYATCTISTRENEAQIASFLERHANYCLDHLPLPFENDGSIQLLPSKHRTDGFFIARMKRCI